MLVTKKSILSGIWNTMELPVTQEQLMAHETGELVQNVFPELTPDEREFIVSGVTHEEWYVYVIGCE